MKPFVEFFVVLFFIFAIQRIEAQNGYVANPLPSIRCIHGSMVNVPDCVGVLNYSIPDFSSIPDLQSSSLHGYVSTATGTFKMMAGSQACKSAGVKYICHQSFRYRCKGDQAVVAPHILRASCNNARKSCPALDPFLLDIFFNCSSILDDWINNVKFPLKAKCVVFPKLNSSPYSCARNYKVIVKSSKS